MTQKEAKNAAEIMKAYADGKEIEQSIRSRNAWAYNPDPIFDWDSFEYRIKKEPTYRPFKSKRGMLE